MKAFRSFDLLRLMGDNSTISPKVGAARLPYFLIIEIDTSRGRTWRWNLCRHILKPGRRMDRLGYGWRRFQRRHTARHYGLRIAKLMAARRAQNGVPNASSPDRRQLLPLPRKPAAARRKKLAMLDCLFETGRAESRAFCRGIPPRISGSQCAAEGFSRGRATEEAYEGSYPRLFGGDYSLLGPVLGSYKGRRRSARPGQPLRPGDLDSGFVVAGQGESIRISPEKRTR